MPKKSKSLISETKKILQAMGVQLTHDEVNHFYAKLADKNRWQEVSTEDFIGKLIDEMDLILLAKNIENINANKLISRIHREEGHELIELDSIDDVHDISHIVDWKGVTKVAIMTRCGNDPLELNYKVISEKHLDRLKRGMRYHGCTHGCIFTSSLEVPIHVLREANESFIDIFDYEDILKRATKIMKSRE